MKNEDIRKLYENFFEEYKEYFKESWEFKLEQVKKYINENKKLPLTNDTNIYIKQLGHWLSKQQHSYKKEIEIMKNQTIRKQYEDFIQEYKIYFSKEYKIYFSKHFNKLWKIKLDKVKEYINKNKNLPTIRNKNKDINQLGNWLYSQQKNYKNRKYSMKNQSIRKQYEDFIEEYKIYFTKYINDNSSDLKNNCDNSSDLEQNNDISSYLEQNSDNSWENNSESEERIIVILLWYNIYN